MKDDDEIKKQLLACLDKDDIKTALSLGGIVASIGDPIAGAVTQAFLEISSIVDRKKVQRILEGLASGLNQETYIYQLKAYISESEEHSSYVANTIRKGMLAESEIVCVLMGRMLADHVNTKEKYDKYDVIILHALGSATDDDMKVFYSMMRLVQNEELPQEDEYTECIEWGLTNRLFKQGRGEKTVKGITDYYDYIAPKEAAYKLQVYLNGIKQVFL